MNFVKEHQRNRLRIAALRCAASMTFAGMTVADIIAAAGTSRVTFYKHYDNKLAVFTEAVNHAAEDLKEKLSGQPDPLAVLVAYACLEVEAARCVLIELPAVNHDLYDAYLHEAIELAGFEGTIGHMLIGAVASILRDAVSYGTPVDLTGLEEFVRPYLTPQIITLDPTPKNDKSPPAEARGLVSHE